jgi:cephalosporin hydroxylase
MNPNEEFQQEVRKNIEALGNAEEMKSHSLQWLIGAAKHKYTYNFTWMGRPIIQLPQDIMAMQEIIWKIQPDIIVETGIAHGGSLIFSASMLELLASCGGKKDAFVIGIDIDIREHNKKAILEHPMAKRIKMIQGSSTELSTLEQVKDLIPANKTILVCLDSNHTHEHVLDELKLYSPLVTLGSYCIVFDTLVEDLPKDLFSERAWCPGNSPKSAVFEFLKQNKNFEIDQSIDNQLMISVAPQGFLKRLH